MALWTTDRPGSDQDTAVPPDGVRTYTIVWFTQLLAVFTSAVTVFSIGLHVYYHFATGSLVLLAIAYALGYIPFAAVSPIAGPLVDRWGQKKALLAGCAGELVLFAALAAVLAAGVLTEWFAWLILLGYSGAKALQFTALQSVVPLLLPKRHIGRANGSRMFLTTTAAALAPIAGNVLLPAVGFLVVTSITCLVLVVALACAAWPKIPSARSRAASGVPLPTRGGNKELWSYLRSRPGLVALFGCFAVFNFLIGFIEVANREISSDFGPPDTLHVVLGVGSLGMLASTVAVTIWGGPRRRVRGMLGWSLVFAASLILGGTRASLLVVSAAAALFLGSATVIMGSISTLLHVKTEPALLGRMLGLTTLVMGIAFPAGDIAAVFCGAFAKPLAGSDQHRPAFLTALIGHGAATGRGYAIMIMALGVLAAIAALLVGRNRSLRELEDSMPDVTPADLLHSNQTSGTGQPSAARDAGRE